MGLFTSKDDFDEHIDMLRNMAENEGNKTETETDIENTESEEPSDPYEDLDLYEVRMSSGNVYNVIAGDYDIDEEEGTISFSIEDEDYDDVYVAVFSKNQVEMFSVKNITDAVKADIEANPSKYIRYIIED